MTETLQRISDRRTVPTLEAWRLERAGLIELTDNGWIPTPWGRAILARTN